MSMNRVINVTSVVAGSRLVHAFSEIRRVLFSNSSTKQIEPVRDHAHKITVQSVFPLYGPRYCIL